MDHKKPDPRRKASKQLAPLAVRRQLRVLGNAVATWRKLQNLTQAQLADRAGITRMTVVRLESGDGGVSSENLFRVLRSLGLLEQLAQALDPYQSDLGRVRADDRLPQRVRRQSLERANDD